MEIEPNVEVNIKLKTGKIEYRYLIGDTREMNKHFHGGWVNEKYIEKMKEECLVG
ncbi:hypothetical protein [Siminovitchia sp. 179-K 8D1 HS]|uniref:hypothetical protein n=1 Tax=Siminovitchia sp. 179-K 8D1 HS TaxID=3142385 RepID=UPI0039A15C16